MRFWDSSALTALLFPEHLSETTARLYADDADVVVWALTPIEVVSALHRRRREGTLKDELFARVTAELAELRDKWSEVLDLDLVRPRAERVVAVHGLRAADALQLAAALVVTNERPQRIPFVSLDRRLNDAARREGFTVLPD